MNFYTIAMNVVIIAFLIPFCIAGYLILTNPDSVIKGKKQ